MKDVSSNDGRTVLFVSHNMSAIQSLCTKALYLKNGSVQSMGKVDDVMMDYLASMRTGESGYVRKAPPSQLYISKIEVRNELGSVVNEFSHSESVIFEFSVCKEKGMTGDQRLIVIVQDQLLRKIFANEINIENGTYTLKLDGRILSKGAYSLNCILYTPAVTQYDFIEECCNFNIIDTDESFAHLEGFDYGVVINKGKWEKIL